MNLRARVALIALAGAASACATDRRPPAALGGYLDTPQIAAIAGALPLPAPTAPEPPAATPRDIDRWWLATLHAELSPPYAAQHFDCALGVRFMAEPRPALTRAMSRLAIDVQAAVTQASRRAFVARPVLTDPGLEACQRLTETQRAATAWPAAGGAAGAAYGELMAALAPDRAEAARRAGVALGESRVVCRMNGPGDVADGHRLGLDIFAQASRSPAFQADLAQARAEVVAARAEGLSNPGCAAERRAYEDSTWALRPAAD